MSPWLDMASIFAVLALAAWLIAALVLAPGAYALGIGAWLQPDAKLRRLAWIAAMPLLVPLAVVAGVTALATAKAFGWVADHCPLHGSGHPHFCFVHLPDTAPGLPHALGLLGLLLLVAGVSRLAAREHRVQGQVAALRRLASGRGRLRILDDARPFAFASGLREAGVNISSGLHELLTPRQRRIVVAHECAHLRHSDVAVQFLIEMLLLAHLPPLRRRLRQAWRATIEERADDRVAARFGNDDVAATLLRVIRSSRVEIAAPALDGGDPLRRARRLLFPIEYRADSRGMHVICLVLLILLGSVVVTAHHALETLVGMLMGH